MNKQKLLDLIKNPGGLTQSDVNEMLDITSDYPYFQIGHALIAKFKSENKALDLREYLHLASISTPDRNVLKALIEGNFDSDSNYITPTTSTDLDENKSEEVAPLPTLEDTVSEEREQETSTAAKEVSELAEKEVDVKVKEAEEIAIANEKTPPPPDEGKKTSEKETKAETPIGQLNIKSGESTTDKLKFDVKETEKPKADDKDSIYRELEENLKSLQRRRSGETSVPKVKAEEPKPKAKKPAAPKTATRTRKTTAAKSTASKATPAKAATTTKSKTTSTRAKASTRSKPVAKATTTARKTTASKTSSSSTATKRAVTSKATPLKKGTSTRKTTSKATSTKVVSTKKTGTTKTSVNKPASTKTTAASKKKLQKKVSSHPKGGKPTTVKKGRAKKDQIEIIENFIKKEPSISKPKSAKTGSDAPQEDLSLNSVEIKKDLISENLAIIMEKQGKTQKAIDIYKKLIWKFPQKKAYFASRIEKLDKS